MRHVISKQHPNMPHHHNLATLLTKTSACLATNTSVKPLSPRRFWCYNRSDFVLTNATISLLKSRQDMTAKIFVYHRNTGMTTKTLVNNTHLLGQAGARVLIWNLSLLDLISPSLCITYDVQVRINIFICFVRVRVGKIIVSRSFCVRGSRPTVTASVRRCSLTPR